MKVWKYPLELRSGPQQVGMPATASIVHVREQDNRPCIWALVHTSEPFVNRTFAIYATGEDVPSTERHVGTVHIGWTVWHIFESTR